MKYQIEEISKKIKIEKTIHKIVKIIVIIFLLLLLFINLMMMYYTSKNKEQIPSIWNISVFNIISESMEPTICVNDLIVIKKCPQSEIKKGDIITFKKTNNSIVTHRIIDVRGNEFVTKGDNNNVEDDETVKFNQIYGKYLFKVKGAGKISEIIQKGNGIFSVILIIVIFIIFKNINDKKKEERKRLREKYDIKKKRDEYNKKNRR